MMLSLAVNYFVWHYSSAFSDIKEIWKNFLWFIWNFFSVPVLLKTFFQPWKRLSETYKKGFDIGATLSSFLVNTMMRLVGMFIRAVVLVAGFATLALVVLIGILAFVIWFFLPIIVIGFVIAGLRNIL